MGYHRELMAISEVDRRHGRMWSPMPLFVHERGLGGMPFDFNREGGCHNEWTSEEETLYVISTSFASEAAHAVASRVIVEQCGVAQKEMAVMAGTEIARHLPEWATCGLGCEDMTDAFRQCPIAPDQQGANIVGYYSVRHKAWRFAEVWAWCTA